MTAPPEPEALQRLVRALLAVGDRYVFLARQRANPLADWTRASG